MLRVESYSFNDLDKEKWLSLEKETGILSIFQTYSWAKVLSSIGSEPWFFILEDHKKPLLGLLTFRNRFLWGAFLSYEAFGGPLSSSLVEKSAFNVFASELKRAIKRMSMLYFYWMPSPYSNLERYFVDHVFSQIPTATFIVDLRPSVEKLWGNLEGRARRAIKKAKRSGVNVFEAKSWRDWSEFYDLYVNEALHTAGPPYSRRLHKSIHKLLLPEKKAKLFVVERHNKIIAGIVFLLTRDEMVGYRGASDIRYLNLSATSVIHWHAIGWAREQSIKYYDIGGALWKPEKNHFLYWVHMFKRQWGGKLYRFYSLASSRFYVVGRRFVFESSRIRRLYLALERYGVIKRTDRI